MKNLSRLIFKNWGLGLLTLGFLMSLAPLSNLQAGKPIYTEPGYVLLEGSVWADDASGCEQLPDDPLSFVCYAGGGPVQTYNVTVNSGKETTVTIVVRHFMFTADFAKDVDFFPNKYPRDDGAEDGLTCFGVSDYASGKYTLYEDYSVVFQTFPEFSTADGEAIQKYEFYSTGTHNFDLVKEKFPEDGPITVEMEFDEVEIGTEGGGQNKRRSCTGEFPSEDPDVDFFAVATFTR